MNIPHNKAFIYIQKEIDGQLDETACQELERHLEICPECRSSARLSRRLGETGRNLPIAESTKSKTDLQMAREVLSSKRKRQSLNRPLQIGAWVASAVLLVLLLGWSIENLRPGQSGPASWILKELPGVINAIGASASTSPGIPSKVPLYTLDPNVLMGILFILAGILPILLVGLIGIIMGLRQADSGWLIILLAASGLGVGVLFWSLQELTRGVGLFAIFAIPSLVSVISLLAIHLWETGWIWSPISLILTLAYTAGLGLFFTGPWITPQMQESFPRSNFLIILGLGLIPAITWLAVEWKRAGRWLAYFFLCVFAIGLLGSFFYDVPAMALIYPWIVYLSRPISILCPLIIVILASRLVLSWQSNSLPISRLQGLMRVMMVAFLYAVLFADMRLMALRNSFSEDQIIGIFLLLLVFSAAAVGSVSIAWRLSGRCFLFTLAIIVVFCLALVPSVFVSPELGYRLTEKRVEQLNQAVLRYHAQNNRYPVNLDELTPRYLFLIPEPLTYWSAVWCYDAEPQYYRLGYYYSPHYPYDKRDISVKIYASAGDLPTGPTPCEVQLASGRRY